MLGQTDKSAEFRDKFPAGKVPALEIHGEAAHLNESNAIADYLSSPDLKGATRKEKAQNNQWIQFSSNQIVPPLSVWVFDILGIIGTTEETRDKAKEDLARYLRSIQVELCLSCDAIHDTTLQVYS